MEQKRLLLAFVFSAAILFGWAYFIQRPQPPQSDNTNSTQQQTANANSAPTVQPTNANPTPSQTPQPTVAAVTPDTTPQRVVTISTPLYEVKLDSRGAVATSWIINTIKGNGRQLYSAASNKNNPQLLQLIPSEQSLPENLRPVARATALRLVTGEANLDALLSSRNYQIDGVGVDRGDVKVKLMTGCVKDGNMTLRVEAFDGGVANT